MTDRGGDGDNHRMVESMDQMVGVSSFLMDNHDRKNEKNWIANARGDFVSIDNGLAFFHGPLSSPSCLDQILSPPTLSLPIGSGTEGRQRTLCLFRRQTFSRLLQLDARTRNSEIETATTGDEGLGGMLMSVLERDPIFGFLGNLTFSLASIDKRYTENKKPPLLTFDRSFFVKGFDHRLSVLLKHIDECVARFGSGAVLAL